jgi:nucleoside-diphosphate-sugar epimerase
MPAMTNQFCTKIKKRRQTEVAQSTRKKNYDLIERMRPLGLVPEWFESVFHLARGQGKTWEDYQKTDVAPTLKLAELCLKHQVKRLVYTSSIATYNASQSNQTITETTALDRGMMRVAPYSRSKVENKTQLLNLHKTQGLPVVIMRPGVVLGTGGNPYHWGIAAWNYTPR